MTDQTTQINRMATVALELVSNGYEIFSINPMPYMPSIQIAAPTDIRMFSKIELTGISESTTHYRARFRDIDVVWCHETSMAA